MTELKPCPFCGEKAEITVHKFFSGDYAIWVGCPDCKTSFTFIGKKGEMLEQAKSQWNRRAYE